MNTRHSATGNDDNRSHDTANSITYFKSQPDARQRETPAGPEDQKRQNDSKTRLEIQDKIIEMAVPTRDDRHRPDSHRHEELG